MKREYLSQAEIALIDENIDQGDFQTYTQYIAHCGMLEMAVLLLKSKGITPDKWEIAANEQEPESN